MDIIKNPIIIGFTTGFLTYLYLKWTNDKKYNKKKNNKYKKDVNLLIPLAVFIIVWFIAYAYFEYTAEYEDVSIVLPNEIEISKKELSETSDPMSFNLVSNGIAVPNKLPDIFFEMN